MYQEPSEWRHSAGLMQYDRGIIMKHSCCLTTDLDWYITTVMHRQPILPTRQLLCSNVWRLIPFVNSTQRQTLIVGSWRRTTRSNIMMATTQAGFTHSNVVHVSVCGQRHTGQRCKWVMCFRLSSQVTVIRNHNRVPLCMWTFLDSRELIPFLPRRPQHEKSSHCTSPLSVARQT